MGIQCKRCGARLPEGATVCAVCGLPATPNNVFTSKSSAENSNANPQRNTAQPQYQNPNAQRGPAQPQYQNPNAQRGPAQPQYQNPNAQRDPAQAQYQNPNAAPSRNAVLPNKPKSKALIGVLAGLGALALVLIVVIIAVIGSSDNNQISYQDNYNDSYDAVYNDDESVDNYNDVSDLPSSTGHITEVPEGYIGIYSVDDLRKAGNNIYADYILMNDLDLSSIPDWESINNQGIFNGNNYTVSNLKSTKGGLLGFCKTVINLNVKDAHIECDGDYNNIGVIARLAQPYNHESFDFTISNCSVSGIIIIKADYHSSYGSVLGEGGSYGNIYISNCTSNVEISISGTGSTHVGGIVGSLGNISQASISNCRNYGKISHTLEDDSGVDVGGIIGLTSEIGEITIENCVNFGEIEGNITNDYCGAGGIVGRSSDDKNIRIVNCCNIGAIKSNTNNIGEIIGCKEDETTFVIEQCEYVKNSEYGLPDIDIVGGDVLIPNGSANAISSSQAKQKYNY